MKWPKEMNAGAGLCMADHQALTTSKTQLMLIQHPSISTNLHHIPLKWSLPATSLKLVNTEAQPTEVSSPKSHILGVLLSFFACIFLKIYLLSVYECCPCIYVCTQPHACLVTTDLEEVI